jgi:hypothetical protein
LSVRPIDQVVASGGPAVERRYRDFVWLRGCLAREVAGAVVPALPGTLRGLAGASQTFLRDRRVGLEAFLNLCADQRELNGSAALHAFLHATDLAVRRQSKEGSELLRWTD